MFYDMTEEGKDAIKKTGDHNWDMERMQFQKEQGKVSSENDYVNIKSKADNVHETIGGSSDGVELITSTINNAMR